VAIPLAMMLSNFLQMFQFAFGPSTKWADDVSGPANATRTIAMMDFSVHMDKKYIFWPRTFGVTGLMATFVILVAVGVPSVLHKLRQYIRGTRAYIEDMRQKRSGCASIASTIVSAVRNVAALLIGLLSTVLVVPVFKSFAMVFDCIHIPGDGKPPFISSAPDVSCLDPLYLKMRLALCILGPLYAVLLIPHALVDGDINYSPWKTLLKVHSWQSHAQRKATLKHAGPVHPHAAAVFPMKLAELAAKVALPCCEILMTSHPQLQTIFIACVGLTLATVSRMTKPVVNVRVCAFLRGGYLATFLAMCVGCLTVHIPDHTLLTLGLLVGGLVLSSISIWYDICVKNNQTRHVPGIHDNYRRVSAIETDKDIRE